MAKDMVIEKNTGVEFILIRRRKILRFPRCLWAVYPKHG
jgi:hypothetical protein